MCWRGLWQLSSRELQSLGHDFIREREITGVYAQCCRLLPVLWERNSREQQYGIREVWARIDEKAGCSTIYYQVKSEAKHRSAGTIEFEKVSVTNCRDKVSRVRGEWGGPVRTTKLPLLAPIRALRCSNKIWQGLEPPIPPRAWPTTPTLLALLLQLMRALDASDGELPRATA